MPPEGTSRLALLRTAGFLASVFVRERASLSEVVSDVVALRRRGRSAVALCPFHAEKTPSFTVSEERGFFHCFGCGEHGDVFAFGAFLSASLLPIFGLREGGTFTVGSVIALLAVFGLTMLACGILNISIERIAYRPLRHAPLGARALRASSCLRRMPMSKRYWRSPASSRLPQP